MLEREGLEAKTGDLEQFSEIIELYMENLKQLHSVNLGAEEFRPVFFGRNGRENDKADLSLCLEEPCECSEGSAVIIR